MPNRTKKENYRSGRNLVEVKRKIGNKRRSFYGKTKEEAIKSYEDAKKKYIEENALLSHGIFPESDITFQDWAKKWLVVYKKGFVREITYETTYRHPIENYLIPYWGTALLKNIKKSDIAGFFNQYKCLSYSELSKLSLCLKGMFEAAQDDKLIMDNPAKRIKLPKKASDIKIEKRAYTYDQARIVIEFAKTHPCGIDIICMLKSGMRRSELLALPMLYQSNKAGGVDMAARLFCVRQSISEFPGGVALEPCKTKKSIRDIPFDEELYHLLSEVNHYIYYEHSDKEYRREYLIAGKYGGFVRPSNWQTNRYNKFKADFEAFARENRLDIPMLSPHELRHSFGSILYERGADIVTIAKLMGHSSIEITEKLYVHDNLHVMQDAINKGV